MPRPAEAESLDLHDQGAYQDHPYFETRRSATSTDRRCRDVFQRLAAATGRADWSGARHLDVGCDTGLLIDAAARLFRTRSAGVDVATSAVNEALSRGLEVHSATLERAPADVSNLDMITAIDLVEHLADPAGFFVSAAERLATGGVIYLATPNANSLVYRFTACLSALTRARPAAVCQRVYLREHIQYLSPGAIEGLARRSGLEPLAGGTEKLAASEIAASAVARVGMAALQFADGFLRSQILTWAIFRKP